VGGVLKGEGGTKDLISKRGKHDDDDDGDAGKVDDGVDGDEVGL